MKKNKRKLNYLIVVILLLLVSVGYAVLSSNLNIVGAGTINNPTWNIHWENVSVKTGSVTASTPTIDTNKTTVNYSVTLSIPGDYYEFTVDVVNNGSIDAMIDSIQTTMVDGNNQPVTLPNCIHFSVTYDDGDDVANFHKLDKREDEEKTIETTKEPVININMVNNENLEKDFFDKEEE